MSKKYDEMGEEIVESVMSTALKPDELEKKMREYAARKENERSMAQTMLGSFADGMESELKSGMPRRRRFPEQQQQAQQPQPDCGPTP